MTMADRLNDLMRWRGIKSQSRLARICGVSQSCIHKILSRGESYAVQCKTVTKLARGLNTSVAWLVDGVEQPSSCAAPELREPLAPAWLTDADSLEIQALLARLPQPVRKSLRVMLRHMVAQHGAGAYPSDGGPRPSSGATACRPRNPPRGVRQTGQN